ncbi:MAG: helix-turn-helix domain-containing protein [Gemmatimonadota bacterium]
MERILLRPSEAADACGVSRSQMYQWLKEGIIPSLLVGGCRRVSVESLRAWIARETRAETPLVGPVSDDLIISDPQREH